MLTCDLTHKTERLLVCLYADGSHKQSLERGGLSDDSPQADAEADPEVMVDLFVTCCKELMLNSAYNSVRQKNHEWLAQQKGFY